MKGIILAGGKGTRLWPLTAVTNKHLVPVGKLPMIEYPLFTLKNIGVDAMSIVAGGEHFQAIAQYFADLHKELNFSYHYQAEAGGIAQALLLTEKFVGKEKIAVILGDNIFGEAFSVAAQTLQSLDSGAMLFLKEVPDPQRFGVAEIKDNRVVSIEEKPKKPKSNLAVTGLYFYDATVFQKIKTLQPSVRGEFEITDVNNLYLNEGKLNYHIVSGFWSDAGTHESRGRCEEYVKKGLEEKILKTISI